MITSAALIMVCVFSSFILNGDPLVKEFGVGLAVAIAIDATLVRCLLVPAVMVLMGDRAWWLPHWLDRLLPNFSIEGEEYFADQDAEAGTGQARRRLVQPPLRDLGLRLLGPSRAPRSPVAPDARRPLELDPAVVDDLDLVAPRIEEGEAATADDLQALALDRLPRHLDVVDDEAEVPVGVRFGLSRSEKREELIAHVEEGHAGRVRPRSPNSNSRP